MNSVFTSDIGQVIVDIEVSELHCFLQQNHASGKWSRKNAKISFIVSEKAAALSRISYLFKTLLRESSWAHVNHVE